ncbi:uncharacterized protein LOC110028854 isoform X2 [Phalaenopsis equestris]|uniref:uncharacterized protein LOC110028854 isoform X2 n=1 Tax=Phalaenopsis equestris TaxID=78828 RepID=UPI0009E380E5|nr:uncharacterized protein LOC110028854 isoform X2 [Phalaenopsis equestris]XP_020586535.1 uncharacterized protein LOC110028854 isoform X2 [Phalaenopsis equestris]
MLCRRESEGFGFVRCRAAAMVPPSIRQMHGVRRVYRALLSSGHSLSPFQSSYLASLARRSPEPLLATASSPPLRILAAPWAAIQRRGAKVLGSEVRTGHVIQRKGRAYQVLKAQHTQHGRGGATIQVELRDIDSGSKVTERFRTDEVFEEVLVEDKSLTVLYQDGESVTLMDPSTFEQLEVPKDLFGKNSSYLKEEMDVVVQFYDGKPTSGSVPQRLTCTVVQAQPHSKGLTAAPQYHLLLKLVMKLFLILQRINIWLGPRNSSMLFH